MGFAALCPSYFSLRRVGQLHAAIWLPNERDGGDDICCLKPVIKMRKQRIITSNFPANFVAQSLQVDRSNDQIRRLRNWMSIWT